MRTEATKESAMPDIQLEQAQRIVDQSLSCARALRLHPLTVAVLDRGGHPVALGREDGSGLLRPQIPLGKAWGALGMGRGRRALAERAEANPPFFNAPTAPSQGKIFA